MRPKVVILVLVMAFGVLGVVAFVKGVSGKGRQSRNNQTNQFVMQTNSNLVATNEPILPVDNPPAEVSDEMRQAVIDGEIRGIYDLQRELDETNHIQIIDAVLEKLSNPEGEVRQTAIRVLREMNDTNAIPGLQHAANTLADPREKVAALDAIDYIKMPSVTDWVPPELATNHQRSDVTITNYQPNPAFLKGKRNSSAAGR